MLAQTDERAVGRRSMSLETLARFGHSSPVSLPAVAACPGTDPPETTTANLLHHHALGPEPRRRWRCAWRPPSGSRRA